MEDQKLTTEAVKTQLSEVMLEQNRHNEIQVELIRKLEALEKKMQEQHQQTFRKHEELEKKMQKQHEETLIEQVKTNEGLLLYWT